MLQQIRFTTKIYKTIENLFYFIFFGVIVNRKYKEQGKSLRGKYLICRFSDVLPNVTKTFYSNKIQFDVYKANTVKKINFNKISFIGSDYMALHCMKNEIESFDIIRNFCMKNFLEIEYIVHPKVALKNIPTELSKYINKKNVLNMALQGKVSSYFSTYCSGGILELIMQNSHKVIMTKKSLKNGVYSPIFSKIFSSHVDLNIVGKGVVELKRKDFLSTPITLYEAILSIPQKK